MHVSWLAHSNRTAGKLDRIREESIRANTSIPLMTGLNGRGSSDEKWSTP